MPLPINASLTVKVGTGNFTMLDGNEVEEMTPVTFQCSVMLDERKMRDLIKQPGHDRTVKYFVGRSIKPSKYIPEKIQEMDHAGFVLRDPATGILQAGEFVITSLVQSKFRAVTRALGGYFDGYFKPEKRYKPLGNGQYLDLGNEEILSLGSPGFFLELGSLTVSLGV